MKIKVEDIPVQFHAMVEIIGIDKFIEVAKLYGEQILIYLRIRGFLDMLEIGI
ncbi:hypothetical protein RHL98_03205 [Clostridioides difficile]|nr:hypothetical protein [Clostridioides difficile]